jgi:hypothetical protein
MGYDSFASLAKDFVTFAVKFYRKDRDEKNAKITKAKLNGEYLVPRPFKNKKAHQK